MNNNVNDLFPMSFPKWRLTLKNNSIFNSKY